MKVIKRNGTEVAFDIDKIINALKKANNEVESRNRLSDKDIISIANDVRQKCSSYGRVVSVEKDIQNHV